jgi:hypothetical protein
MFFSQKGYTPLVLDTDGVNFSLPEGGVDDRVYIAQGHNPLLKKGEEFRGYDADVAEYNDTFMKGVMYLDCDGTWDSCINLARKNYATMEHNGKIKLTGNTIKSKKLPLYIEEFLDKGVKQLLEGKGKEFVEWYYEYINKIFDQQIPLMKIAQRAKVKLSLEDYVKRSQQKTKSGGDMSKMAHMELAIKNKLKVNLGDIIYYVNNGTKASQGDVQKVSKLKRGWSEQQKQDYFNTHGKVLDDSITSMTQINCYMLDMGEIENNPDMLGEYNVPRAIDTFNKRIGPLLVVFKEDVRKNLIVKDPEDRGFFTNEQCELISGLPFNPGDQDTVEDLLTITQQELDYWDKRGIDPYYVYELAEEGWEQKVDLVKVELKKELS